MSDRSLWACDRCGCVFYGDGQPSTCGACHGTRRGSGVCAGPDDYVTFSEVSL